MTTLVWLSEPERDRLAGRPPVPTRCDHLASLPLTQGGFIGVKQIFKIGTGRCGAASKTAKIKNSRPKNAKNPKNRPQKPERAPQKPKNRPQKPERNAPKNRKIGKKTPPNNPEGRKKDGKNCRQFSFYTANCEQTVNERNFQIFSEKTEKCEKMKIIFTFPLGRSC